MFVAILSKHLDALLPSCDISTTVHMLPSEMETYLPFAPSPEDVPVEQLHALVGGDVGNPTAGRSWKGLGKVPKLSMSLIYIGSNEIVQLVLRTNIKSPTSHQLCHGMTFRISNAHCLELLEKKNENHELRLEGLKFNHFTRGFFWKSWMYQLQRDAN